MSAIPPSAFPKVSIGTLAHPAFGWPQLETARGTFDFSLLDAYVDNARQQGLVEPHTNVASLIVTLGPTPRWAVSDQSTCAASIAGCAAPPDSLQDWKDFLFALVARYDGAARPQIRWFELWDASDAAHWNGTDEQLAALAAAAYPIIRRDAYSRLLTPSFSGPIATATSRMSSYLGAGGAAFADGGAFSGYVAAASGGPVPYPMPEDVCSPEAGCWGSIAARATQMRDVFDRNGLAGKPMFQVEGGWGLRTITNPDTQLAWIARYFLLQAGLRSKLDLQVAAWYAWSDPSSGWGNIEDAFGNPTAAGLAYERVYHWIVGATMADPCSASGGVWTCTLTRPGGYTARAVWTAQGSGSYAPGHGFTQYRDLAGNTTPIAPGVPVPIGPKPILLEGSPAAARGAPNILLILTDDQDTLLDSLKYMPRVKELLTDRGAFFTNAFVPLSLCCPSRATILRGQYPHNSGVLHNILPNGGFERAYTDDIEASTIATLLHGAGYRTVLLGKYLNGYPIAGEETYIPPGWDEWYSPARGNPYVEYDYSLNENGALVAYLERPSDYLTDVISGKGVDFIRRSAATPAQPIFVYFATYAPHSPYTPAPRHDGLFPGTGAPRLPTFNQEDVSARPSYLRALPPLVDSDVALLDTFYRMRVQSLQAVDEAVASLLSALAAAGRLDNTYVVFTSDNGYHMGEYRLLGGKYTPYSTDIRVPLVVRGPGIPAGTVREEFVSNIDLAETFAEMAGLAPFDFSDGRSLKGLASGVALPSWRRTLLLEEFSSPIVTPPPDPATLALEAKSPSSRLGVREPPDPDALRSVPDATAIVPSYYGFQAPGYKYVEYQTKEKELYVASDPYDVTNVYAKLDPAIAARLAAHLRTLVGCKTDTCRAAEDAAPPLLLVASFTVSPPNPRSGETVTVTASATGTAPYVFTWTADGATRTGPSVQFTLPDGTHAVTLRARDAIGAEALATRTVTVGTPPTVEIQTPSADLSAEAAVPVSFLAGGTPSIAGGTFTFTWDFGDGTPQATGPTVTRPFGAPGTYIVTLTGVDSRGAVASATRAVTITRPTLAGASLLLPVVLESPGAHGSSYTSEVTIASRLAAPVDVLLAYTASVGGGSGYARLTLAPGEQRILSGVIGWLRGRGVPIPASVGARVGTLLATFANAPSASGLFLGARTFTADPSGGPGTFGLFYVAAPGAEDSLTVFGLQQNAAQRSNLALVNSSASPVALRAVLRDGSGTVLREEDAGLMPWGWLQLDQPLAGLAASGSAVVTRTSGVGSFTAYGVLNDQVTSDGSFVPPLAPAPSGNERLVPIVLSTGAWTTELTLTNLTSEPLRLDLTYTAAPQLGRAFSGAAAVTLTAGEQRIAPDALAFLRQSGIDVPTAGGGGSLRVVAASGVASDFAAGARTFTRAGGGTFGVFYAALTPDQASSTTAFVHALRQDAEVRSNVAVVNWGDAGDPIAVRITYHAPDGSAAGDPDTLSLAPGEWAQRNGPLASRGISAGWAMIEKIAGDSRFVAYGVLNDQTNSDGSYVPATP